MKHFLIEDFLIIANCKTYDEIPKTLGYESFDEMECDNGGTELTITELSDEQYMMISELDYYDET